MAIGVFKLTKKQRLFLSMVLMCLNVAGIVIGLSMVALYFYIIFNVAPVLYSERAEVTFVYYFFGFMGALLVQIFSFGIAICRKCTKQTYKKSTRNYMVIWSSVSFFILFGLLHLASNARKEHKHMIRSMKHSLYIGMQQYLKKKAWKISIDRLQTDLQCCGIESYEDWHTISWLNLYVLNNRSSIVKEWRSHDGTWNMPVTPWSCCKMDFPAQCLHDPLQQSRSAHVWHDQPSLVTDSINNKGCLELLKKPLYDAMMAFIVMSVVAFLIKVLLFLIMRIVYTSFRNALMLNDTEGIAPGWIFGRGDCGYNRGKTLFEIMGVEECDGQPLQEVSTTTRDDEVADENNRTTSSQNQVAQQEDGT